MFQSVCFLFSTCGRQYLPRLFFMTVTCKRGTYSSRFSHQRLSRRCLHPSCGSCQSRTLWHANCHGDMCVTASESLFIGVRHAVRPAWFACDRALMKGPPESKIDTTHTPSLVFSPSLSFFLLLAWMQFLTSVLFVTLRWIHNLILI